MTQLQRFRLNLINASNVTCGRMIVEVRDPVYGSRLISHFEFLVPVIVIGTTFLRSATHANSATQCTFSSYIDIRIVVTGVKMFEVAVSLLLCLALGWFVQVYPALVRLIVLKFINLVPLPVSPTPVILLLLAQSPQSMLAGLAISFVHILVTHRASYETRTLAPTMHLICSFLALMIIPLGKYQRDRQFHEDRLSFGTFPAGT